MASQSTQPCCMFSLIQRTFSLRTDTNPSQDETAEFLSHIERIRRFCVQPASY